MASERRNRIRFAGTTTSSRESSAPSDGPKIIEAPLDKGLAPKGKLFELSGRCAKEPVDHPAFIIRGVMEGGRFEFLDTLPAVDSVMGGGSDNGLSYITESTLMYCHFCKESMGVLCNACDRFYCNGSLSKRFVFFTMFTCPCGSIGRVNGVAKLGAGSSGSKGKGK